MPWLGVVWTTATLFSEVCPVSTCTNCSVFKTHLVGLSESAIDTHSLFLFLKKLHWLPVEFWCIFKTATSLYKLLHSGHPSYFNPQLSIYCGKYGTTDNSSDKRLWRFLNITLQNTNPKQNTSVIVLLLMFPHLICLMLSVLLKILLVSGKS